DFHGHDVLTGEKVAGRNRLAQVSCLSRIRHGHLGGGKVIDLLVGHVAPEDLLPVEVNNTSIVSEQPDNQVSDGGGVGDLEMVPEISRYVLVQRVRPIAHDGGFGPAIQGVSVA